MREYLLSVISPQGKAFEGVVASVVAPGEQGFFEVLAGHAAMVVMLKKGIVTLTQSGQKQYFAIGPGVLEVNRQHEVLLLSDHALPANSRQEAREKLASA